MSDPMTSTEQPKKKGGRPPKVVKENLPKLEALLNEAQAQWEAQPQGRRNPTLPCTNWGKVNVAAIAKDLGVPEGYLFDYAPLRDAVNAVALAQGLQPIGAISPLPQPAASASPAADPSASGAPASDPLSAVEQAVSKQESHRNIQLRKDLAEKNRDLQAALGREQDLQEALTRVSQELQEAYTLLAQRDARIMRLEAQLDNIEVYVEEQR